MASAHATSTLDQILAVQLTVAWAGEARAQPRRLGWWETDLVDEGGGGDLFARLLPTTHAWASLEAVREAARRVDAKARKGMGDADRVRTLFFLGFELDEQLADRLAALKSDGRRPGEMLAFPVPVGGPFASDELAAALGGDAAFKILVILSLDAGKYVATCGGVCPTRIREEIEQHGGCRARRWSRPSLALPTATPRTS